MIRAAELLDSKPRSTMARLDAIADVLIQIADSVRELEEINFEHLRAADGARIEPAVRRSVKFTTGTDGIRNSLVLLAERVDEALRSTTR